MEKRTENDCTPSDVAWNRQSFAICPPRTRWLMIQEERRAIKNGARVATHRFRALEPTCGNFFCVNPDHMVEVSYSPAMAAAVTNVNLKAAHGDGWDKCSISTSPLDRKKLVPNDITLKFSFDRMCDSPHCVNPNHYRMKTKTVTDDMGGVHKVASNKFRDMRSKELNSVGKTWLYLDLARGIGPGARVVDAEQTCGIEGCVSCWRVTKVWKCETDYGEDVAGWPWQHAIEALPYGGLDVVLKTDVEVIGGESLTGVNPLVAQFSPRAARIIADARRTESCAVWPGANIRGYPFISGRSAAHRRIIELDTGVQLGNVSVKNTCKCTMCILPEHWSGWQHLKDVSRSENVEKELAERKAITKSAIAEALRLDKENGELKREHEEMKREHEEMKRKIAELMARLGDAGEGAP